ncbi:23S rRNA (pseudouridine(1915)-N(3))-methyltransferase RlmH [Leeia sp. TBRC 13508]|uniref:Ribosomal RNA large subunit methyltransferase H n=1 Tax=Leeia speluncae TaxID=2884804 RepID=A0ABS8D6V3_9NEIS|nr:23S rRNA (pseudouridine(1915)-N(3))-methyltransferase RlmH [Leeia speluncae]MCB6183882.1 23S rRNA (pseudouridine(1915)-N(3))-methyltransferase RlmH [Leeia speluncae]
MKLSLLAVGQKQPGWMEEGYKEYAKRMPREWPLQLIELKPEKRVGGKTAEQVMAAEKVRILDALPKSARLVAMDERGARWTTMDLAKQMEAWQQDGRDVAFVIGGADGLDPEVKQRADQLLALSPMTLPHGLARVMLAEQLYRAVSILNNHPYHRE